MSWALYLVASSTIAADPAVATATATAPAAVDLAAYAAPVVEPDAETEAPALWAAYLRIATIYALDGAVDAVSEGPGVVRGELGVSRRIDERWWVELGGAGSETNRRVSQAYELWLATASLQASIVLREPLWWRLVGVGRATAALDVGRLSVEDERPVAMSQSALGFGGVLTAGLALDLPIGDSGVALALSLEGGFQLHGGFVFDGLTRDTDADTEPARIATSPVDAGGLSLTGGLWRLGVAVAF